MIEPTNKTEEYLLYEQEIMERVKQMHEELIHSERSGSYGRSEDRGETHRDRGAVKE